MLLDEDVAFRYWDGDLLPSLIYEDLEMRRVRGQLVCPLGRERGRSDDKSGLKDGQKNLSDVAYRRATGANLDFFDVELSLDIPMLILRRSIDRRVHDDRRDAF